MTEENDMLLKENLTLLNFPLPLTLAGQTGIDISPVNIPIELYVLLNFLLYISVHSAVTKWYN